MIDYGSILDDKTKKRLLLDKYEDQKNMIRDKLDLLRDEPEESVALLEKIVETLDQLLGDM